MRRLFLVALIPCFGPPCCHAIEVGYSFSGMVSFQISPPFGKSMTPGSTPVVGKFIYDTDSPATHDLADCGGDCTGYRQTIVNGFSAAFGNVLVRADEYIVAVFNDTPDLLRGGVHDVLAVRYYGNLDPPLIDPLIVDGVGYAVGRFNISFGAASSLFPNSMLPSSLDPAAFPVTERQGTLSHAASGPPHVLFTMDSLLRSPIAGNYDFDQVVDASDYGLWKESFGSTTQLDADGNRDRIVNAADYTVWRDNLGAGASAANPPTVPEPSAMKALVFMSMLAASMFVRQMPLL